MSTPQFVFAASYVRVHGILNFVKIIDGKNVYSVKEVNNLARLNLERIGVWVEGELSSFKGFKARYRYIYFDLKDPISAYKIPCIMEPEFMPNENTSTFRSGESIWADKDQLEDGMKVLVNGTLTLWEKEGKYQMYVFSIQKFGEGLLLAEFEKLKSKLQSLGYFDIKFKKALPKFPTNIAVITSQASDAWHDFQKHSSGIFSIIKLTIFDVMVQGEKSISLIVDAIKKADKYNFDLIVIIRGGGSLEDLASFNDELIATTIFKAKTPILVGVGHEKDVTIASLVADVAASTPTDAAKIVAQNFTDLEQKLYQLNLRLKLVYKNQFSNKFQLLDIIFQKMIKFKEKYLTLPSSIDYLKKSLIVSFDNKMKDYKMQLANIQETLILLSPENTLRRGFSITTNMNGQIIKDSKIVEVGEKLKVKLASGKLTSEVLSKKG